MSHHSEPSPHDMTIAGPASRLLTPAEAANRLQVSIKTLEKDRCTRAIGIPYVKLGKLVRYQTSDLDAFIAIRHVAAGAVITSHGGVAHPRGPVGAVVDAEFPGTPTIAQCIAQLDIWSGHLEAAIDHQAHERLGQHANDEPAAGGRDPMEQLP